MGIWSWMNRTETKPREYGVYILAIYPPHVLERLTVDSPMVPTPQLEAPRRESTVDGAHNPNLAL
jgi:hypothetical protein